MRRKTDRNGRVTVYARDEAGQVTEEIWYASGANADADRDRLNTIRWTYDSAGNLLSVADDYSSYAYAYDPQGRVVSGTVATPGGPVTVLAVDYGTRENECPVSLSASVAMP